MVPGAADEGRGPRPFVGSFVLLCVCQLICTGVGAIRSFPYFRFASLWFLLVAADARTSSLSPVHPSLSFPGPLVAHPLHSPIPHTKHTPGWTPHMVHTHTIKPNPSITRGSISGRRSQRRPCSARRGPSAWRCTRRAICRCPPASGGACGAGRWGCPPVGVVFGGTMRKKKKNNGFGKVGDTASHPASDLASLDIYTYTHTYTRPYHGVKRVVTDGEEGEPPAAPGGEEQDLGLLQQPQPPLAAPTSGVWVGREVRRIDVVAHIR